MDIKEYALELWRIWVSKRMTKWAATVFIVSGIGHLTPLWWYGLANAAWEKFLGASLAPFQESPGLGWSFIAIGITFILIGIWENTQTKKKEIIALRHKSIGSFPKKAIKPDLPFVQKLWHYRELDIDHTDSYSQGVLENQNTILRRLKEIPLELNGLLNTSTDSQVAYYGIVHIPLAFYLGYLLSDHKKSVQLFEYNNEEDNWSQLKGFSKPINTSSNIEDLKPSDATGDVVFKIGFSYAVHNSEINELNIPNIIAEVAIQADQPQRLNITSQTQIELISKQFKSALEKIKHLYPNRQRIHLFYSGSVSLAFALGQCVSERIDSEIIVYNFSSQTTPKYEWGLSVNSDNASPVFATQPQQGGNHAPL